MSKPDVLSDCIWLSPNGTAGIEKYLAIVIDATCHNTMADSESLEYTVNDMGAEFERELRGIIRMYHQNENKMHHEVFNLIETHGKRIAVNLIHSLNFNKALKGDRITKMKLPEADSQHSRGQKDQYMETTINRIGSKFVNEVNSLFEN